MKINWPGEGASLQDVLACLKQMHDCAELNSVALGRQVKQTTKINLIALIALVVTVFGSVVAVARWTGGVSAKLDGITQIIADAKDRDARINAIDVKVSALQAIAEENKLALMDARRVR